jgi:fatty acid desaturase
MATTAVAGHEAAIPARTNLLAAAAIGAGDLAFLFGVPALLAAGHGWAPWLALPFALSTIPHWALIHEAVHGHLHPRRGVNHGAGRLLAVLFLAPFDALRFGHLSHHALNARATERPECYDPHARAWLGAAPVFYARLLGGVYLAEAASSLLSLLPRRALRPVVRKVFYDGELEAAHMADRAERALLAPRSLRRIRTDAVSAVALLALSAWTYGAAWPVLALALLGRAFLVSFMDNAPHYGGPLADPDQGYDMRVPAGLDRLVLHTNLHGTHHRYPNLPWTALPAAFRADGEGYAGSYLVLPWRQLKGPVPVERVGRAPPG